MNARLLAVVAVIGLAAIPFAPAVADDAPSGAASCSGCHAGRAGVETAVPRLTGRNAGELAAQMQAFRSGQRPATVMDKIAKGFSDAEVQAIAAWYAAQR
jgi:sulfide dehydrogenase cytochrome subunit